MWTLFFIMIFEIGSQIPLPNVSITQTSELADHDFSFQILSAFTGARMMKLTLFSIGMGPYMSAMIIWQTISMLNSDSVEKMSQRQQGSIQKIIGLLLAFLQSMQIVCMYKDQLGNVFGAPLMGISPEFLAILFLTAGAMMVTWLADCNTNKGIGGTVVLILPSMMENVPAMLSRGMGNSSNFNYTIINCIIIFIITIVLIWITVFLNKAELRIPVERTTISNTLSSSYIPIRFFSAGAMPFMFAMSLFTIPSYFLSMGNIKSVYIKEILSKLFSINNVYGVLIYGFIIILLGYGFSFVNIRVYDIAKELKKSGDYIYNLIPGRETETFLNSELIRLIFMSNSFMLAVGLVPLIIGLYIPGFANVSFYFGSIIIVITMMDNIIQQIVALATKDQYSIFENI
ncbi:accessory Sec system protein translocase subunit SecY2 [Lactiplantibacillus plantarum]|uniref:accessory Sec system protein translocase subunit SecY2 n=1 Tax=Lactiplantibacillus plantarum TaxID=1590 RepID=UPI002942CC26|nr:accessory Sec system protein translocase subunit SecY2 [Lactiplantibacillus plantarum]WOI05893.1 accessory Sec system protein translocase subunit SecY2 [Lactiplantibacillus plantarum]